MLYDIADDVVARLGNTVVLYDDRPYMVENVARPEGAKVFGLRLLDLPNQRNPIDVRLDDPKLNYTNYRLGYANYKAKNGIMYTYYLTRMPCRNPYKQGLCQANVNVREINGGRDYGRWNSLCASKDGSLHELFSGNYPSLEKCVALLEKAHQDNGEYTQAIAFHRNLALVREPLGCYKLFYKGEEVAWGDPMNFKVPSQFMYLNEALKEIGVTIR